MNGIILDKSYLQGAPKTSFDAISSTYRVLMPDVLFYEMLSSDEPGRSQCFAKLPQTPNPIPITPHVGALLSLELATHRPAGAPSKHLLDIDFRFNPGLSKQQYEFSETDIAACKEIETELVRDIAALIEKVDLIATLCPGLTEALQIDKATAHREYESAIANEREKLAEFISSLSFPDGNPMPSASGLDEAWTVFRWLQAQLLFSLDLRVRYEPKVFLDPTPKLLRRLEHDVLDLQYLILGVLEGGFATKERKLQRFFKILCPDGILVEA